MIELSPDGRRTSRFCKTLISIALLLVLSSLPKYALGQNSPSAAKAKLGEKKPPLLTSSGQPDLEGLWDFNSLTQMERPAELAGKEFLTEQEAADWTKQRLDSISLDRHDGGAGENIRRGENEYWMERGSLVKTRRTSLVIDPPDGKIPPLTEGGRKRLAESASRYLGHEFDGPESLPLPEMCVVAPGSGPPISTAGYNNNVRIQQGPGYVVILHEINHEARVIPLDGRPHLPAQIRQWNGDSRGHWEGDTLVVETTNFVDRTVYRLAASRVPLLDAISPNMRLTERFKRLDKDTLQYRFTIDDPSTFVRPWTVEIPATITEGPQLEVACHEGNLYNVEDILEGARADEKKAAQGLQK